MKEQIMTVLNCVSEESIRRVFFLVCEMLGWEYWIKGNDVMVRIKVSYEEQGILRRILERLQPDAKSWKISMDREGLKAYIILK